MGSYDLVTWPIDGAPATFDPIARFTYGVRGAVMIGWALTIFALQPVADVRAWRSFTGAMMIWYVIDTTVSVTAGAPGNGVSNTVFLALFLIPVLASGVLSARGAQMRAAQKRPLDRATGASLGRGNRTGMDRDRDDQPDHADKKADHVQGRDRVLVGFQISGRLVAGDAFG